MLRLMLALLGFTLFKIPVHHVTPKDPNAGNGKKNRRYSTPKNQKDGKDGKDGNGNGGNGGNGGSGGSWEPKKSDDRPQFKALQKMLGDKKHMGEFRRALNTKLGNINLTLRQNKSMLLDDYKKRAGQLQGARTDNLKAAGDSSYMNLANRGRERQELLAQTATQGAGESDTLKTGMQALRNWSANQSDVNRSFYDTARSVNSEVVDLNASTRTAQADLYNKANSDKSLVWGNYYDQRTDAWTQMGNIQANPNSNMFKKNAPSFGHAAKEAGNAWKQPKLPKEVTGWKGTIQANEQRLNNSAARALGQGKVGDQTPIKKPEGATLRKW